MNAPRLITLAALALLAGCISGPQEMIEVAKPSMHASIRSPEQAALCIARNAENDTAGFHVTARPSEKAGMHEIQVRTWAANILAYAVVEPAANGSRISLWLAPPLIGKDTFTTAVLRGC
jgi:hypothetical protein